MLQVYWYLYNNTGNDTNPQAHTVHNVALVFCHINNCNYINCAQDRKGRDSSPAEQSSSQVTPSGSPRKSVTMSTPDSETEGAFPELQEDPGVAKKRRAEQTRRRRATRDSGVMGDDEYDAANDGDDSDSTSYYLPTTRLRKQRDRTVST